MSAGGTQDGGSTINELLRERRTEQLKQSITELSRRTGTPRSYIHDCESGRKFPSRQWVERLASIVPADPKLLLAYHHAAFERTAAMKHPFSKLTSQLAHEIDEGCTPLAGEDAHLSFSSPPREFEALTGRRACLQRAVDLIASAPARPDTATSPQQPDGVVLVYAPSLERSELPWQAAFRRALGAGWTVVHVLSPEDEPDRRIQRVRDLLGLVGRTGAYIPVVLPHEASASAAGGWFPAAEIVVAPGEGVLQLYSSGASASYFPWKGAYEQACRNLENEAQAMRARGTQVLTKIETAHPQGTQDWAEKLAAKLVFDCALTDAITSGGRRVLLKNGLVLSTMPPHATLRASARLKAMVGPNLAPLIESVTTNRLRRWQSIETNTKSPNQHICTIPAVLAYLAGPDEEPKRFQHLYREHDLLVGGMNLERADRIEHVKVLIDILRGPSSYEIGLVEDPASLPVPILNSYWVCTETGLFYAGPGPDDPDSRRFITIRDSAVIDGFFQVADGIWESIPVGFRDREAVATVLERLVDEAEQGMPMLDRPLTYAAVA